MKTIETEVAVGIDGTAVIQFQLAADIAPGLHRAVVVLEETSTVGGNSVSFRQACVKRERGLG